MAAASQGLPPETLPGNRAERLANILSQMPQGERNLNDEVNAELQLGVNDAQDAIPFQTRLPPPTLDALEFSFKEFMDIGAEARHDIIEGISANLPVRKALNIDEADEAFMEEPDEVPFHVGEGPSNPIAANAVSQGAADPITAPGAPRKKRRLRSKTPVGDTGYSGDIDFQSGAKTHGRP